MNPVVDQMMDTVYKLCSTVVMVIDPLFFALQLMAKTEEESRKTKTLLLIAFIGYTIVWLAYRLIR